MAVKNINNYTNNDGFGMPLNIRRGNPNPLDNSEIWKDLTSAKNYAENDPTAYVGQIISYFLDDNTIKAVQIADEMGTLKNLGGDGNAIAHYYTAEEWAELDPVLEPGALGIDATNGFMKIGNGKSKWSEIDFAMFPVSLAKRSDNLLLTDSSDNLFLSKAAIKALIAETVGQIESGESIKEYVTFDGYTLLTADGYEFQQR